MHHTDVLRELMILNDMTIVGTAKRLGKSHTSVMHNLQSRDISFENIVFMESPPDGLVMKNQNLLMYSLANASALSSERPLE